MNMTYPDERLAVVVNGLDRVPAPPVVEEPVSALESQQP
jgi:hypothetical protein